MAGGENVAAKQQERRVNVKIRLAVLSILGAAAPLMPRESLALDAAEESNEGATVIETIVVTAEKREEPLKEVPMSVSALGGDLLDKVADRDFADYAALVPGLSLASSQPGLTRLTLRGQNTGGVGSTVAVYIDESPFGSSSALLNGSINTGDFDTWDMQRIEVLRGPQGTLYGSNSEGGLLKFVTNSPILGTFSGAGEVSGESVDHGGQGGDVRGMVNLPLGNIAALRLSGFDDDIAGYISDPLRGVSDANEGHKYGGRASLLVEPSDDLTFRLTATTQQSRYDGTNAVDVDPVTLQPIHGDLTQERNFAEPSHFKYDNYNATVTWNAGPFSILSTTSYGILKTDTVTDYTNAVLAPATTLGDLLAGAVGPGLGGYLDDNVETKKITQEIRLSSPDPERLEWQVGGYFTHEYGGVDEHLTAVDVPGGALAGLPSLETPIINSSYQEWAGFASATYHFIPQFDLEAGGRYSANKQTADETITGLLVSPQAYTAPSSGNVFTYSVAPRWHVDKDTMVYARVATGYRPGGPNVIPPAAPPDVPREYAADKTTNEELGVRTTQLDGLLSVDVAVYHVDWKDVQLLEEVDTYGINANGGKARSQGVEWTIAAVPVRGLTLQWVGAYTDAKLTTAAPAVNGNPGDPLPYAPKYSTSLDGEYDWSLFGGYKAFVGSTWSYVGTRSTDFASSAATPPGQLVLPIYNTVAARIGIDNDRYRVTVYAKNIGDVRGITDYVSSGAPGLAGEATVIQPRTIGLTLAAKF
jgi:iron complex outermembrane recepter protein